MSPSPIEAPHVHSVPHKQTRHSSLLCRQCKIDTDYIIAHSIVFHLSNNLFILPDLPSNRISIPSPIISSDILGRSAFLWEILSLVFTLAKIFPPLCIFSYWLYLKCEFTLNVQSAAIHQSRSERNARIFEIED